MNNAEVCIECVINLESGLVVELKYRQPSAHGYPLHLRVAQREDMRRGETVLATSLEALDIEIAAERFQEVNEVAAKGGVFHLGGVMVCGIPATAFEGLRAFITDAYSDLTSRKVSP